MRRAWFSSLTRWMDRARGDVLPPDAPPQPQNLDQHRAYWGLLMQQEVVPQAAGLLARVRNRITRRSEEPVTGPEAAQYLNEAGNRLVRLPDEVYALIVRELETGMALQESVPELRDRVQAVLTSTGSEHWPRRAVTVARTEVMGAVNAGAWFGAQQEAARRGDPAPFKAWLATKDQRTRPTHREADGQRTLLSEPFLVGGARLQFPGDPRGPAQEVIQCRCSLLPVILGEQIDWTSRGDP